LLAYADAAPPDAPQPQQMEHPEDVASRHDAYVRALDHYLTMQAHIDLLRQRLALEEPPCDEAAMHQEFQNS
jgi:hypothetical protein